MCPRGDGPHKAVVKCRGNPAGTLQAARNPAIAKTGVKMTLDERQSVFTLIRTDTTHDLSQKAEKVCPSKNRFPSLCSKNVFERHFSSHKIDKIYKCVIFFNEFIRIACVFVMCSCHPHRHPANAKQQQCPSVRAAFFVLWSYETGCIGTNRGYQKQDIHNPDSCSFVGNLLLAGGMYQVPQQELKYENTEPPSLFLFSLQCSPLQQCDGLKKRYRVLGTTAVV